MLFLRERKILRDHGRRRRARGRRRSPAPSASRHRGPGAGKRLPHPDLSLSSSARASAGADGWCRRGGVRGRNRAQRSGGWTAWTPGAARARAAAAAAAAATIMAASSVRPDRISIAALAPRSRCAINQSYSSQSTAPAATAGSAAGPAALATAPVTARSASRCSSTAASFSTPLLLNSSISRVSGYRRPPVAHKIHRPPRQGCAGQRRVPAGPPDRQLRPVQHADHGVVARDVDGPVVREHRVGEPRQAAGRVVVIEAQRLFADVGARHHQRVRHRLTVARDPGEQQVMHGAVGQHDAEQRIAGRDVARHRRAAAPTGQHDRPGRAGQRLLLGRVQVGEQPGGSSVPGEHREQLGIPRLALAQPGDRVRAVGPDGQVVPADALDGDDPPVGEGPCAAANTPAASLPTNPVSPSSVASRYTNGRKPTPCTTPVTVKRRRCGALAAAVTPGSR
jgi:hypothetical protein